MSKAYHVYLVDASKRDQGVEFYKTCYDKTEAKHHASDAYESFAGVSGVYVVDEDTGEMIGEWGSV